MTFLLVASSGNIVGTRVADSPSVIEIDGDWSEIDCTGMGLGVTVTVQTSVLPPSFEDTVIVHSPALRASIVPPIHRNGQRIAAGPLKVLDRGIGGVDISLKLGDFALYEDKNVLSQLN